MTLKKSGLKRQGQKLIKEMNGNLIKLAKEGNFEVIVHGCNCQGIMGKGIAKQIKEAFPKAAKIDEKGETPGTICSVMYPSGLTIINAYTQIYYGKANEKHKSYSVINDFKNEVYDSQENRYNFIRSSMRAINKHYRGKKIGLPLIGCGLAGGEWNIVKQILEEELSDCNVTVVHYKND